jgi:hypothetical protein
MDLLFVGKKMQLYWHGSMGAPQGSSAASEDEAEISLNDREKMEVVGKQIENNA